MSIKTRPPFQKSFIDRAKIALHWSSFFAYLFEDGNSISTQLHVNLYSAGKFLVSFVIIDVAN